MGKPPGGCHLKKKETPTISLENPDKMWKPPQKSGNPQGGFHILSGFSRLIVGGALLFEVETLSAQCPKGVTKVKSKNVIFGPNVTL